jgi:aryl-alcohol dehydrogenase-like predicted oxidoreductase
VSPRYRSLLAAERGRLDELDELVRSIADDVARVGWSEAEPEEIERALELIEAVEPCETPERLLARSVKWALS